jgi:quercetin dioxygenase-like cupin family protein
MAYTNLVDNRVPPTDGLTKEDILTAEAFTIGLISLDIGQEIEPHPEPYEVFFFVLEGTGEFTTSEGTVELTDGDALYLESGERRGIRCTAPLTILGVQEAH